MKYLARYEAPIGEMLLAADGAAVCGAWIYGQKYFAHTLTDTQTEFRDTDTLCAAKKWLDDYFAGKHPRAGSLRLSPDGSDFRKAVWDILLRIPYGSTVTYGAIAEEISRCSGRRMSAQAVGGAVGHNPISILIPCHRVVGSDGSLTGYAGGIRVKQYLLAHEGADMSKLFVP